MAFRNNPNISNNQTSGLHISNAITNRDLVVTGRSLTGAQPMDVSIVDSSGNQVTAFNGLVTGAYDYVGFSNADVNGNYQTVVYKSGGSGGTLVNTLSFTFDGSSNVTSITKT